MEDSRSIDTSLDTSTSVTTDSSRNGETSTSSEGGEQDLRKPAAGERVEKQTSESSFFHGFSSQEEGVDTSEEPVNNVKQMMFDDFGLGNEASEEDTELSDADNESSPLKIAAVETERSHEVDIVGREREALEKENKMSDEHSESFDDESANLPQMENVESVRNATETEEEDTQESSYEQHSDDVNVAGGSISPSPNEANIMSPSPKKVHFSDNLEDPCDEPPQLPVRPKIGSDLMTPSMMGRESSPPLTESTPKKTTASPPLKLKIKFGKDSTGTITHGKIKKKSSGQVSSDEDKPSLFTGMGLVNESLSDEELQCEEDEEEESYDQPELPEDPDTPFHGYPDQTVPDWVFNDFGDLDLRTGFKIKPTVFVSISSKKNQQKALALPPTAAPRTVTIKLPVQSLKSPVRSPIQAQTKSSSKVSPVKTPTPAHSKTPIQPLGKTADPVPTKTSTVSKDPEPAAGLTSDGKKRVKGDKNLNYVKPLLDGWVREVVWRAPSGSKKADADVYYYPPDPTGNNAKKRKFRSANELEGFLITSGSQYPMTFFTFKKEPVGGPEGMEIVRDSVNTPRTMSKPGDPVPPESPLKSPVASVLGKRVSKPPDKLILDTTETDVTPSRVSKRVSRPPDKLELDSMPVAKAPRLELTERRQASPKLESWTTALGPSKTSNREPGTTALGPSKSGNREPGTTSLGPSKTGIRDPGITALGPSKTGIRDPGTTMLGPSKAGNREPGTNALGPSKTGIREPGTNALGPSKAGNREPGTNALGPSKAGIRDPENIVQSPKKQVTTTTKVNIPGGGTLKLKMFSKMMAGAKNQVESSDPPPEEEENVIEKSQQLEKSHPGISITPAPPKGTSCGMTITKVKKVPPQAATINLPGLPTTGPPPVTFDRPPVRPKGPLTNPSISITPLNNSGQQGVTRTPLPSTEHLVAVPKILRPCRPTQLPCSIHCPGVTGFPSLSCTACHCLFHPKCVGLPASLGSSANHEFYCNDCTPPTGSETEKLNGNSKQQSTSPTPLPPPPALQRRPSPPRPASKSSETVSKTEDSGKENKENKSSVNESRQPPKPAKVVPPPAPFSGQGMISIAGRKFLVIPHPTPVTTIESPPPSPPLPTPPSSTSSSVKGITPVDKQRRKSQNSVGVNEKLDYLLKPADPSENVPSFEVEQTPDGKYLLLPLDASKAKNVFAQPAPVTKKRKSSAAQHTEESPTKCFKSWGNNFTNNLSGGYHAMLQVFRYLPVKERILAGSVCKLWRDISLHPSLWRTVSLKNTRVYDWKGFGRFLLRSKATHLDVRKMLFVKDRDQTWSEILAVAASSGDFSCLKKVELPKVGGSILTELVAACPRLESVQAPLTSPPLDVNVFGKMPALRELKLKSGAGGNALRADQGIAELARLAPTITHLSLLTVEGLSGAHFDVLGTLVHLQILEVGDCTNAPPTLFKTLSDLSRMERLRLEKGTVGENLSKLANAPRLTQLELIDFQVLPGFKEGLKIAKNLLKLLIIPSYKDEVAKINSEIVEGVTQEMNQLLAFYLGVTNEWLEAMALAMGGSKQIQKPGGEKECFPLERSGQVEHISLPALYRLICREMPHCKVKVLKMSAQATCKQFIANLDQS